MTTEKPLWSDGFQRLYCDASLFASFSTFHPVSFARVLPFRPEEFVADDARLIGAESAHLADQNDLTRREVIEAFAQRGLLTAAEANDVKTAVDYFGADFFELMGLVYANAGSFTCALRWYRELIAELETNCPESSSDNQSIYASVGYCLYSLGLFEEAILWSKSCIGPHQTADVVCRTLLEYEAQQAGGAIRAVERVGPRTKYIISAIDSAHFVTRIPHVKATLKTFSPFHEVYIDVVTHDSSRPGIEPGGYPFRVERDAGSLLRHRMNLIFATCGQADKWVEKGYTAEAKRLLLEITMLEPEVSFVWDRLKLLS